MIIRDITELTPRMQCKVAAFLRECKERGLDCHVFESYRTQERQDELYAQGRTEPGNIVTWTLDSRHKQREAVDMAFGGDGKWHWNGDWEKMIEIASHYGLESLAPREMAHLQCDGKEFNKNKMNEKDLLPTDWSKIMREEVDILDYTVGHNAAAPDEFEQKLRSLVELMMDRKVKKLLEKLTK